MLSNKYLQVRATGSAGFTDLLPLPKSGKAGRWWLGAGMIYIAVGAPGSKKVIREIASIIDQPKYFAKIVTGGVGSYLVFNAAS